MSEESTNYHNMKKKCIEAIGWLGVAMVVGAYALNTFGVIESQSIIYAMLNIVGSIGIAVDAWFVKNYQPVVLNIIWMIIAIVNIVRVVI